jgi:hypothetical protein
MLLLRKVRGEETVFQGHLYVEKTSVCAVIQDASNPDDMEVKNSFGLYLHNISSYNRKKNLFSELL